ncbi:MAG: Tex family protein [Alphaproteobacteria bacterium]|nr:Tex family protein [Alphaproteobacteria bacterium]
MSIAQLIAQELGVKTPQVQATIDLLDGGATVPFIARYRKEATGGLDDVQLRELEQRLIYLREMHQRRDAIIQSVEEQSKMTPELLQAIMAATTKQVLEDLYLPFKPKRRTKAMIARDAGLEPLALALWNNPELDPQHEAQAHVSPAGAIEGADFSSVTLVLDGVRDLISEMWAEDAVLLQHMRDWLWNEGLLRSRLVTGKNPDDPEVAKFRDYFEYDEAMSQVPSHRALAVFRGRTQGFLDARLALPVEPEAGQPSLAEGRIAVYLGWSHQGRPADDLLRRCVGWTWRVKLSLSIERDLFAKLRESAEQVAIKVFGDNVRDLLLAAPAGPKVVMGLDPGIRTGVKVAVVSATGRLLATETVYPHEPRRDWEGSLHRLGHLCVSHGVDLIAIGNGTASRETDHLAADLIKRLSQLSASDSALKVPLKVVVSEAGASVYSASEFASQELPDIDVSLRGAVSIARRLQDPLAELVKIDPKSIGVGQYQHDVNPTELARTLTAVVEDCVNKVGVDLNTASVPLLSRVSGLSASLARSVVRWRDQQGAFRSRIQLLEVTGLGPKTFEQCAGFLRIRDGEQPLDMTSVHPESYPVVERILGHVGRPITEVMGRADMLKTLRPDLFANDVVGVITIKDILVELEKPGRDPRPDFQVARFTEGVEDIGDLKAGMVLEGTVSNVAAFGAFVDLGVHQDGLVHVSQLANRFVQDAREVVKTGDVVKVKVLEVDVARKRISLSMRSDAAAPRREGPRDNRFESAPRQRGGARPCEAPAQGAMASAFAKLQGLRS